MAEIRVDILRITDSSFPGFIEFSLTDCKGVMHRFIEKIPIVSSDYFLIPPCTGYLRCTILGETACSVLIDTSEPDSVESLNGEYRFEVSKDLLLQ